LPLSLVLYVVLVLSHGAPGAAIGALAATVAGVAVAVRLLAPVAHPLIGVATLGRVGVATLTACVVAAVWKSSGWSLAVELVACALVYALLLVLLREVTGADLALVRSRRSTSDS
jgi:hypothetical protein